MEELEIINKYLLEKVSELTVENKRLNDVVDKLHAECCYYENHWKPIEWKKRGRKKKEEQEFPL